MDTGKVRQFVRVSDGRVGVVIANETCGGVFRGHCDLWFGEFDANGNPKVLQLPVEDDWCEVECPLGETE